MAAVAPSSGADPTPESDGRRMGVSAGGLAVSRPRRSSKGRASMRWIMGTNLFGRTSAPASVCQSDQERESSELRQLNRPEPEHPYTIHPEGNFAVHWSLLMMVAILYGMIMIPLRIAFGLGMDPRSFVLWFDVLLDVLFMVDIFIQSRLAYKASQNDFNYVFDLKLIRWRYLKSWFFVDLLAAVPFDLIMLLSPAGEGNFILTKLVKTFRLMRIAKLLKISKLRGLLHNMEDNLSYFPDNPGIRRMMETFFLVFLLSHTTACAWYFVSVSTSESGAIDSWVSVYVGGEEGSKSLWSLYLASLYWSVSTLTSVGFGDFEPQNDGERMFATLACFAGATVFGYVIGQMSSMVADLNQASFQFHRKMDSINSYLRYRKVPQHLQRRIRRFYRYYISRKMLFDEEQILEDLTHGLKVELSMFLTKDVLKSIHIFKGIESPAFMSAIVTMLKPFSAAPGDYIIREGDVAQEMYLIVRGTVEVLSRDGVVYTQLSAGNHFGEITYNHEDVEEIRASSARALTYCDLFSFSKADLAEASRNFPELYAQIQKSSQRRAAVARNLKTQAKVHRMTTGLQDNPFESIPDTLTGTTRGSETSRTGLQLSDSAQHLNSVLNCSVRVSSGFQTTSGSLPDISRAVGPSSPKDELSNRLTGSVPDYSSAKLAYNRNNLTFLPPLGASGNSVERVQSGPLSQPLPQQLAENQAAAAEPGDLQAQLGSSGQDELTAEVAALRAVLAAQTKQIEDLIIALKSDTSPQPTEHPT